MGKYISLRGTPFKYYQQRSTTRSSVTSGLFTFPQPLDFHADL